MKQDEITANDILNEKLLLNKNILIGNKTVQLDLGQHIIIKDILDSNYNFRTLTELRAKGAKLTQLQYNSLVSAIPKTWITKLKSFTGEYVYIITWLISYPSHICPAGPQILPRAICI